VFLLLPCLLQLPRKLGLIASQQLPQDPCSSGPVLPGFLATVCALLSAAEKECTTQVQAEILQQLKSSGLFRTVDQLKEATAQQLEQDTTAAATAAPTAAAGAAAAAGVTASDSLALRETASGLMCFQVC
jgi:hypothetical protein